MVNILSGVIHWHVASADREFTPIAINSNTQNGIMEWLGTCK
ncbi:cupin domain-containing protein [Chryseobacterium elymi]|nr:hypothetical protein [Chryseobacterium elymi]